MSIEDAKRTLSCAQGRHEVWTGPDESDCPTSPIAEQLQRQSQKVDELQKALESLLVRLAGVLERSESTGAHGSKEPELQFSSEVAVTLYGNTIRIDQAREIVSAILSRLEI